MPSYVFDHLQMSALLGTKSVTETAFQGKSGQFCIRTQDKIFRLFHCSDITSKCRKRFMNHFETKKKIQSFFFNFCSSSRGIQRIFCDKILSWKVSQNTVISLDWQDLCEPGTFRELSRKTLRDGMLQTLRFSTRRVSKELCSTFLPSPRLRPSCAKPWANQKTP